MEPARPVALAARRTLRRRRHGLRARLAPTTTRPASRARRANGRAVSSGQPGARPRRVRRRRPADRGPGTERRQRSRFPTSGAVAGEAAKRCVVHDPSASSWRRAAARGRAAGAAVGPLNPLPGAACRGAAVDATSGGGDDLRIGLLFEGILMGRVVDGAGRSGSDRQYAVCPRGGRPYSRGSSAGGRLRMRMVSSDSTAWCPIRRYHCGRN